MATTKVIYKSITLQPGEPFTLPPGAVLVSADSPEDLESNCDQELEELACYTLVVGNAESNGGTSQLFESERPDQSNVKLIGISVNNVDYLFDNPILSISDDGRYIESEVLDAINSTAAGQLFILPKYGYRRMLESGTINYITFKGAPSVIANVSLIVSAYVITTPLLGPSLTEANTTVKFYIKPVTTDSLTDYIGVPQCD